MASRSSATSADASQEEYSELEDEIFLPYLEKVRPNPPGDPGRSASASEWEELPLESEPNLKTVDHIDSTSTSLNNVLRSNHVSRAQAAGLDGSDSEPVPHALDGVGTGGVNTRVRVSTLSLDSRESDNSESPNSPTKGGPLRRDSSILDGLLCEIYDRCQLNSRYSIDSDGFTEYSSNSEGAYLSSKGDSFQESTRLPKALLNAKGISELQDMVKDLQHSVAVLSGRLIKQLKRRDRYIAKLNKNQDVLTAVLQAVSQKRRVDARLKFSIEPLPGKKAFRQWYDALRAVGRLPKGLPQEFRKSVWLSLANRHIKHLKLDWPKTVKFTFNDRSNPDDDTLGVQIVKDLHRTGCSGFCGQDAEDDRVVLKRVLLAYARWNKSVGYCQGFNVLAALILEVMERVEDDALKVMIFLIDHVLPDSYFANNLRALSVDMAVFRELLHFKLPELAQHLDKLQKTTNDGSYEPPLTNVFTMQWFLTLFATCLPKPLVLRVWDSIFLEGSEILLRVALAIWAKLADKLIEVESADEFYSMMGLLGNKMLKGEIIDGDELIQTIYSLAPFPFPHLNEIREKYMFSITPFAPLGSLPEKSEGGAKGRGGRRGGGDGGSDHGGSKKEGGKSDEEGELDEDEIMLTCFTSLFPMPSSPSKGRLEAGEKGEQSAASPNDITRISPGAYGASSSEDAVGQKLSTAMLERMNMDIYALKKQYWRIQRRQQQAHVIYSAGNKEEERSRRHKEPRKNFSTSLDSPSAINHLLIGKHGLGKKTRKVAEGVPTKIASSNTQSPSRVGGRGDACISAAAASDKVPARMEEAQPAQTETEAQEPVGSENENESEDEGDLKNWEDGDEEENEESHAVKGSIEPPVGLLIDFGSPEHKSRAGNSSVVEGSCNGALDDTTDAVGHAEQNGSASSGNNSVADVRQSTVGAERRKSTDLNLSQSRPATQTTETAKVSPLVQQHRFNFAVEAYRPVEVGSSTVEGAGNPKMYGQSNAYRPWLHSAATSSDSDSDSLDDNNEEDDRGPSHSSGVTPSKTAHYPAYNPFPARRLQSERDRTRTRLKVGLYKTGDRGQENGLGGRCINQQLGANSRSVKTGGRF
ncbi:TBC1 domain family member 30-like [Acanthaster planci]|uniref:TBC1 domain family member 30 n=1 Tax=Acanthaster planci TaxID=133434 RepID=A0A8B7ZG91_ACAPL|nr:TBC1 domain family member 30-like [Acanthaster planci]